MPNSVQKKLSSMFSRASLSDKGNSATKLPSKGISKRFSLGSPVVSKENDVAMGGGNQEAMLTFIEQQGNQISQLKEHIASLEAKLLASPPGLSVKPAALLFSPIRGAQGLSDVKSPKKCISVSQAVFIPQGSRSPLSVIVSPYRNPVPAATASVAESSPMAAVQVMHYSQLSFDSTFSTANGSDAAAKEAIPFQEFIDSCLSENVMSPTARPLLASFICGETSGIQEHALTDQAVATNVHGANEDIGFGKSSPAAPVPDQQPAIGEWIPKVVVFSLQQYWMHSVTATIDISEHISLNAAKAELGLNLADQAEQAVMMPNKSMDGGIACSEIPLCQHEPAALYEILNRAPEEPADFEVTRQENLVSPCVARIFHASPSLDAAAANHVQSKVSPGFSVVSPIMEAACSNQASGNESTEFPNHIVINGLVFSGMAKLPEHALRRIKHSRADFQLVNGVAWVPDCLADNCMLCEEEFSFFFRRHHCRSCGIVICSECSEWNKEKRCCTSCMHASQTPSRQNLRSHQVYYA